MIRERIQLIFRKGSRSRGQGMLEFALALPIFLMLVLGVIEFGRLLAVVSSVTTAAREGARYGSAAGLNAGSPPVPYFNDCQGMREAAKRVGFFAGIQDTNLAVGYFDADSRADVPDPIGYGATNQCIGSTSTFLYDPARSPRVVVKVSVTFKFLFLGLPPFPISSQSARTIVTQIEMDVTPGTITPAPPKTATSTVTGTPPTLTATATFTLTPSATPTIDETLTTLTPSLTASETATSTLTPTATSTATPLPLCGFVSVGGGIMTGSSIYGFSVYNQSGLSGSPYPAQSVWVRAISISWTTSDNNFTVTLDKINYNGSAVYTAPGGGDSSPKNAGFGDGGGPLVAESSNGALSFVFKAQGSASAVITSSSLIVQYKGANGNYYDCPASLSPNPLVQ